MEQPKLILRPLTLTDEAAFLTSLQEWQQGAVDYYCVHWTPGMTYPELVQKLNDEYEGKNLPAGHVPASVLYAFVGDKIVGRLTIRHVLSDRLLSYGGNIGYGVNASCRGRGYATEMLRQALEIAKGLNLSKVLFTVDEKNSASIKVIENNGGVMENSIQDGDITRNRYWIHL